MRFIEVSKKYFSEGKKKRWKIFFKAYDLWSLFWGIDLKLIDVRKIKKISEAQLNVHDKEKSGFLGKLGEIVKKMINCEIESFQ